MLILYIVIAFFVFYFVYRLNINNFKKEGDNSNSYNSVVWLERPSFWVIFLVPITWIAAIPIIIVWKSLDKIFNKYFKGTN